MSLQTKINNTVYIVLFLTGSIFWNSCGNDRNVPDVSGIQVDIKVQRFEKDLFALDTAHLEEGMAQLMQKYPDMLPLFAQTVIHDQTNRDETPLQAVGGFLRAPQVRQLYDTVQTVYGDLSWLERDLTQMFKYYKYYFPEKPVPQGIK